MARRVSEAAQVRGACVRAVLAWAGADTPCCCQHTVRPHLQRVVSASLTPSCTPPPTPPSRHTRARLPSRPPPLPPSRCLSLPGRWHQQGRSVSLPKGVLCCRWAGSSRQPPTPPTRPARSRRWAPRALPPAAPAPPPPAALHPAAAAWVVVRAVLAAPKQQGGSVGAGGGRGASATLSAQRVRCARCLHA